ncbi:InlB B-repeat-containing protein, partial [Methanimicrococcus sp. OttesenSCG-928-J09]|nr:InlB B-repeat-containing protein [Methanimicrococcus sp. OttesenSCG-928-J09]
MEHKNRLFMLLLVAGIVLVMMSGMAVAANQTITLSGSGNPVYSASDFPDFNAETDYLILSGTLTGTVTINSDMKVLLNGVTITQPSNQDSTQDGALMIGSGKTVTLYLADGKTNTITGADGFNKLTGLEGSFQGYDDPPASGKAGISVPQSSTLIITTLADSAGSGILIANGGDGFGYTGNAGYNCWASGGGAGIGGRGGYDGNAKNAPGVGSISILSGNIYATGGAGGSISTSKGTFINGGAGRDIGGGGGVLRKGTGTDYDRAGSEGGNVISITISGGTVNANTYGIGGGNGGDSRTGNDGGGRGGSAVVTITGGTVNAGAPAGSAAIGGGNGGQPYDASGYGGDGTINIDGETVVVNIGSGTIGSGSTSNNKAGDYKGNKPEPTTNIDIGLGIINPPLAGYDYITVNVKDEDNLPLSGAAITLTGPKRTLNSDSNNKFTWEVSNSPYTLTVTYEGEEGIEYATYTTSDHTTFPATHNVVMKQLHPVTFYLNGGSSGEVTENIVVKGTKDQSVSAPADPTKTGATFIGWFTKDGTGGDWGVEWTSGTFGNTPEKLYACYGYTVTNTLTNAVNNNLAETAVHGSDYSATISANEGYTLGSVVVTMGDTPVTVTDGVIFIPSVTGNIVITAVASGPTTDVTFDANGGSFPDGNTMLVSAPLDQPMAKPDFGNDLTAPTNKQLAGWSTNQYSATPDFDFAGTNVYDGLTLYAVWEDIPQFV